MTKDVKVKAPKRRKSASLDKRKARGGWIFVLPFVIGFVLIYLPIVVDSIKFSFHQIKMIGGAAGYQLIPVGWENYRSALLDDTVFVETLVAGVKTLIFDIPMILIFSLFMAVLLNQKMAGRAAFRAILFLPVIVTTGCIAAWQDNSAAIDNMGGTAGIDDGSGSSTASEIVSTMDIERMFSGMAIGQGLVDYVAQAINNIYDIANRSGVQILIFLAGLQSISPAIYESVQIDGATAWETFWKITFPMISPMILVNAVYTVIDSFTAQSNQVMSYINKIYEGSNGDVLSSAMSWIYFLIVILILAIVAAICSAFVFYQRRD